jgi:hypothetical protein
LVERPETSREALRGLFDLCPEFLPVWDRFQDDAEEDESMYMFDVWCDVLSPFFDYAFPPPKPEDPGLFRDHWIGHRRYVENQFATEPYLASIPRPGRDLDDLVSRLFVVLDRWTRSADGSVTYYVGLNMVVYGQMPYEDFLKRSGPDLTALDAQYRETGEFRGLAG